MFIAFTLFGRLSFEDTVFEADVVVVEKVVEDWREGVFFMFVCW